MIPVIRSVLTRNYGVVVGSFALLAFNGSRTYELAEGKLGRGPQARAASAAVLHRQPASSEYVPEDLPKRRTRLLNKADGKNRESENPEEISLLSGRNPTVVLEHRGERFETENRQRGGGGGTSVCEYDRNDKAPKGLPHGVWR